VVAQGLALVSYLAVFLLGPGSSRGPRAASADSASSRPSPASGSSSETFPSKPDGRALEAPSGLDPPLLGVVIEGGEMLLDSSSETGLIQFLAKGEDRVDGSLRNLEEPALNRFS